MNITVEENTLNGLCCSCGVCEGACPKQAISMIRNKGMYLPEVNFNKCINCGICAKVCPGFCQEYHISENKKLSAYEAALGLFRECWNAWSKDAEIRHVSASGGVVTTLIKNLLKQNQYDVAFCVQSYNYDSQLTTSCLNAEEFSRQEQEGWKTPKSRYLPVSHSEAIRYILSKQEKKVIITAVPCALQGIANVIRTFHLQRKKYLLIGLFCEKEFQYNLNDYLRMCCKTKGKRLVAFHFKNKDSGGWPGNMKFMYSDGTSEYIDKSCRTNLKGFFQPERCLYCIDKLATQADIALGDNYTGDDESELGSNSVIIRTHAGQIAWENCTEFLEKRTIDIRQIATAAVLEERVKNYGLGELKKQNLQKEGLFVPVLNSGIECTGVVNPEILQKSIRRLRIGENIIEQPNALDQELKKEHKKKIQQNILYRLKFPLSKVKKWIKRILSDKKKG